MGEVILSEFVTLDGVMQDPGGGGEFEHGGWQVPFFDDDLDAYAQEVLAEADALLLGRVTFEEFAQAWPSVTDDTGFADRMNSMSKFVASTTLSEPLGWNATLIRGDVANEVRELKEDHTLLINGSGQLVQTLMRAGLIDDFRIWVHPVVVGAGKRLFTEGTGFAGMELKGTRTTGRGIVILELEAAR
ncbi:MAG TPA: dihydrofolate reductase family protein [Actinomycetota bacterium]|jgi:dihydrofolate reductase|nr:dihydrofolate reductase family protein [Actinomycetota bacterium]